MKLTTLVKLVNNKLAGEQLSYQKMVPFLDSVIDDINQNLNSVYPAFSELPVGTTEYAYFPDRFIRTVVANGAAFYFYQMDEEGLNQSPGYQEEYQKNMFYMVRDFIHAVPTEYQDSGYNGTVPLNLTGADDPSNEGIFNIDFYDTRI
jgi:hypothetical protein